MTRIAIIGGGPAGYEAALVADQLGAEVTLIDRDGVGGQCVLSDCVPSKTFIATSEAMMAFSHADRVGVRTVGEVVTAVDEVNARVKALALAQSADITRRLAHEGVTVLSGTACLKSAHLVEVQSPDGHVAEVEADVVLLATGARPRVVPGAEPDGERILDWRQLYDLEELPTHLVVIGSGVTGAEFANAYLAVGSHVTLVSSRERVLPGEDVDAAELLQTVFERRGMNVRRGRAARVERRGDGVVVHLTDGTTVQGSHALMTVGSVPNTAGMGLEEAGVALTEQGFVQVDRVSRTTVPGVYAAGDCTGVLMLASVAAMQGRIAMWHALGEAVAPLRLKTVSANVFTDPQVASVGVTQTQVEAGEVMTQTVTLPLATNARAKMQGITDGFVKLFCRPGSGTILGGVVVAPNASELIMTISLAVQHALTADQVAHTFAIYPSLSGSVTEAARQLMLHDHEG
ncbi:MAG: pyridine nucleotide-disulfide oxidoreductase dimerization region [Frankiales bacterium]|jgi:pyruvate/2-oxoglutarate dehydrogenase complex dihydrolipoamide dehydrogenase (E3) component|nr:pyridine nucleotide-disulfide oxidoreductase dimerization region [Frankiales bacterium]